MERKFLAAKVNINGNIFSPNYRDLIKLIPESMKNGFSYKPKKGAWVWEFGEIKEVNQTTIAGFFTKSKEYEFIKNVDGKLIKQTIPKISYPSFFIYDFVNEILVFEETSEIKRNDFITAFENYIYFSNIEIGKIEVNLLPIKERVYEEFESIEYITKIEFDLVHPNSLMGEEVFNHLERIIKDQKATRIKTSLQNEKGLDKNGKIIRDGLDMVSRGYGDVKFSGYNLVSELPPRSSKHKSRKKRKKRRKYNSKDSIQIKKINKATNEYDIINLLCDFISHIKTVINRGD